MEDQQGRPTRELSMTVLMTELLNEEQRARFAKAAQRELSRQALRIER